MVIASTKITYSPSLEEYRVKAFGPCGERLQAADYFTDDKGDAIETAKFMRDAGEPITTW